MPRPVYVPGTIASQLAKEWLNKLESADRAVECVPRDFTEFAALCQIKSGADYVPFKLYDYQIELAKLVDQYPKHCIYKTRQLGASETIGCKMLHRACLQRGYSGVVISIGQDESSMISNRLQAMPSGIRGFDWEYQSAKRVKPVSGGNIYFRPSTDNAARSLPSVVDLFIDEASFIDNASNLYASASPAQKMAGAAAKTYVVSTLSPRGRLTWFWELFSTSNPSAIDLEKKLADVREGRGEYGAGFDWWIDDAGWCKILIHWKSHPIYMFIPNFLEDVKQKEKLSEEQTQREYNLVSPSIGSSLFNENAIDHFAKGVWQLQPTAGHRYLCCIDPNFGGEDYWVTQFWDITTTPISLAYEYRENRRSPNFCKDRTMELILMYAPVLIAIESNSGGVIFAEQLTQDFPKIQVEPVNTNKTSKIVNTDRIAIGLERGEFVYPPDWAGIQEMRNFDLVSREAAVGHDDTIMCWAIGMSQLETAMSLHKTDYIPAGITRSGVK